MPTPSTVTASEARRSLFPLIGAINDDGAVVRVTSKAGNVVIIAEDEYDALEETAHLLRSPANAERLLKSLAALQARRKRELVD